MDAAVGQDVHLIHAPATRPNSRSVKLVPWSEGVVSVRLATFNLENLGAEPAGAPALEETLDDLRPQIVGLEADILCLQEVNAQRPLGGGARRLLALEKLLAGTPYETYHLAATRGTSGRGLADSRCCANQTKR